MAVLTRAGSGSGAADETPTPQPDRRAEHPVLQVDDHLEPRVRIPADLVRCVIAVVEIALLIGLALLASKTATGVEFDFVNASERIPGTLLRLAGFAGYVALLILPLALAVRLCMLRQFRRLAEAVATAGIAVGVVALANVLLNEPALHELHLALHTTKAGMFGPRKATLDGYLAGLVAYVTVVGLRGRDRWRTAYLTAIGFYAVAMLTDSTTTVLALLITVAFGSGVGSGLRYALGTISGRPTAAEIAATLGTTTAPIVAIRRLGNGGSEVRRYAATTAGGERLDVSVFDRDQQAADAFYRLYRRIRLKTSVSRSAPLSLEGAIERQALLAYATEDAGVRTPRLHAVIKVGPDAAAMATEHVEGTTLAEIGQNATDDQLRHVWDTVLALHKHRVTHRALTADRIMFAARPGPGGQPAPGRRPSSNNQHSPAGQDGQDGQVVLLDPGNGDVAATDLQFRLDLAQLIAQTALLVGPDRAADIATEKMPHDDLLGLVPLLQPVVLYRSTRSELRGRKSVLTGLRKRLTAGAPDGQVAPVQLERIRPRALITLIAGVFAAYILAGQLGHFHLSKLLAEASLPWTLVALVLSGVTYVGATMAISGFVLEKLNVLRTFLVQVAGSFVILVTPAAVGGVALNVRYLRKAGLSPADAGASVGVTQVISFAVFVVVAVVSGTIAGSSRAARVLTPPSWAYIALAALVGLALIVLALPAGRRQLISRVGPLAGQVIPRLLDVAQRPMKLAQGAGGSLLMMLAYILCLAASLRAVGDANVPLASIAVVYLVGNAASTFIPTPGGIGAVETALSTSLALVAGVPAATAITAVLLFRTLTFWLPVLAGWVSLHYLQRVDVL
ncbi:MAG TPA: lysylphosphatidylglycerol synthase domain-containing protein [Streptosporangiaceae bacterium]|nr:lysylphosphatidylglycerol synthase domain-containing protein [Streptosporangiaceae bacterium]